MITAVPKTLIIMSRCIHLNSFQIVHRSDTSRKQTKSYMKHLCTQNDLVRYLYRETSASENEAIEEKMEQNWSYREAFLELREAMLALSGISFSTDSKTVDKILSYSRKGLCEPQLN